MAILLLIRNRLHELRESSAAAAAATTIIVTGAPSPTAKTNPSSTKTTTSATETPTNIDCPGSNNTVYTATNSSKRFTRVCGIDYSGKGEAVDLGSVKTENMTSCIDACAKNDSCQGCGWGRMGDGDTGNEHSCWLKANLTKSHNATADWEFAILAMSP
jgi:hypothetical protein